MGSALLFSMALKRVKPRKPNDVSQQMWSIGTALIRGNLKSF
jgi:hypothetical protein